MCKIFIVDRQNCDVHISFCSVTNAFLNYRSVHRVSNTNTQKPYGNYLKGKGFVAVNLAAAPIYFSAIAVVLFLSRTLSEIGVGFILTDTLVSFSKSNLPTSHSPKKRRFPKAV